MITGDASDPGSQMLTAGCYTVLTTNSDDLGLGLPVLGAIFPPQLVNMCFVLNALQSMIINPMIFLMLGVGAAQRDAPTDGTPPASTSEILRSVIRGLSKNHIVLSVVFGLLYNIIFSGLKGAELPFYIDNLCKYFGGAFGPMVLFMGGAANVGAFSKLAELQSAIMPIGTVLLKSFLLPAIVLMVVSMLGGSREILDFAFAFSTLPVAASTLVFANPYKPNAKLRSLLNSGLALGKLIGFPLIFLSAAIFKTHKVRERESKAQSRAKHQPRNPPPPHTLHLLLSLLPYSGTRHRHHRGLHRTHLTGRMRRLPPTTPRLRRMVQGMEPAAITPNLPLLAVYPGLLRHLDHRVVHTGRDLFGVHGRIYLSLGVGSLSHTRRVYPHQRGQLHVKSAQQGE